MEQTKKQKIVDIEKGLFLVRYAAAEDESAPPRVSLSCDPRFNKNISLIIHPDHETAVLWQPGACMIVRATAAGKLCVDVAPTRHNGSAAATIRIEPLTQGLARSPRAAEPLRSRRFDDFRVEGHVASVGDVVVSAAEWLAGPLAPSRIEGISIIWPGKPRDLEIRYSVKTARAQANSGRLAEIGAFAGTRGKALPIVGLMIEMSGPGAANVQFTAEAIFLGSPAMRLAGKRIAAAGPTGREPLVGLRLGLEEVSSVATVRQGSDPPKLARPSSRVRVFRSPAVQEQPRAS